MNYTYAITHNGQITLPKQFRQKLGLDKIGRATISLNDRNEIVITRPKDLAEVRSLLQQPSGADRPSADEEAAGQYLAHKYGVR